MVINDNNLNKENASRQNKPDWAGAMQIFGEISSWIAMPIVLALIAGKALDKHFGTKPYLFLALALLGFVSTVYGITRAVKNYIKKLQDMEKK